MTEIQLGDKVKDMVTGFVGVAYSVCENFNGCIQFDIVPEVNKDGTIAKGQWIDSQQLKIIKKGAVKPNNAEKAPVKTVAAQPAKAKRTGGPMKESTSY